MTRIAKEESGQAMVELSVTALVLCILIFGIVDFSRAIYDVQVMKNLAGEGSAMASRGTSAITTTNTLVNSYTGSDLDMTHKGCVIVTVVTNNSGTLAITDQGYNCAIGTTSQIGCLLGVNGCRSSSATLPSAASTALTNEYNGSTLAVTEIYYNYSTITPATALLGSGSVPTQFYSVAYY